MKDICLYNSSHDYLKSPLNPMKSHINLSQSIGVKSDSGCFWAILLVKDKDFLCYSFERLIISNSTSQIGLSSKSNDFTASIQNKTSPNSPISIRNRPQKPSYQYACINYSCRHPRCFYIGDTYTKRTTISCDRAMNRPPAANVHLLTERSAVMIFREEIQQDMSYVSQTTAK